MGSRWFYFVQVSNNISNYPNKMVRYWCESFQQGDEHSIIESAKSLGWREVEIIARVCIKDDKVGDKTVQFHDSIMKMY